MELSNKVLYNRARPCAFDKPNLNQSIAQNMLAIMREKNGIGIAAPQLGSSKRLFVMEIGDQQRICFNPEITEHSNQMVDFAEGCLSFPGESCIIKRPDEIAVRYQNYRGDWYAERLSGLMARCFQHELDHLDGIVMQDRMKDQHAEQS